MLYREGLVLRIPRIVLIPEVLTMEIVENLESALEQFRALHEELGGKHENPTVSQWKPASALSSKECMTNTEKGEMHE